VYQPQLIVASAARTVSGDSGPLSCNADQLQVGVIVTAASGTGPSMALTVQWSFDGVNFSAGESPVTFAAITAAKVTNLRCPTQAPFYKLAWVLTGTTPSFTFSAYTAASV
jgi:hypothetical protein